MSAEMRSSDAVSPPVAPTVVVSSIMFVGNSILIGIDKEFANALLGHILTSNRRQLEETLKSRVNDTLCAAMDEIAQQHDQTRQEDRIRHIGDAALRAYAANR